MGSLEGKVAIVTGGGTGIGKAITRSFYDEGCSVVIASRGYAQLEATARELDEAGTRVYPVQSDVTEEASVLSLFKATMERFGRLDVLVNNAGAFDGGRIDELTLEAWKRVIDTNVTGAFLCTREAFRIMKESGGGRIINIGSISAQRPRGGSAPYSTSKHAIWGLTQASALDGRPFGITASCLHPGNTQVERRGHGPARSGDSQANESTMDPADLARTALLMATLPPDVNLLEAIVLPVDQLYLGRG